MARHAAKVSSSAFDLIRGLVEVTLPALATLYATLATIWDLPGSERVVLTIAALTTFLGVFLKIQRGAYNKSDASKDGALVIDTTNPTKDSYSLEIYTPLADLEAKDAIVLKVNNVSH